jgi:hypothetical protein
MMQPSNTFASNTLPGADDGGTRSRRREDLVYQGVTIAAILMVLCSVLLF